MKSCKCTCNITVLTAGAKYATRPPLSPLEPNTYDLDGLTADWIVENPLLTGTCYRSKSVGHNVPATWQVSVITECVMTWRASDENVPNSACRYANTQISTYLVGARSQLSLITDLRCVFALFRHRKRVAAVGSNMVEVRDRSSKQCQLLFISAKVYITRIHKLW
jgi:hypothetical protein